jgi:hypothetical protein
VTTGPRGAGASTVRSCSWPPGRLATAALTNLCLDTIWTPSPPLHERLLLTGDSLGSLAILLVIPPIEIQSLGGDTVTSATAASKDWLAANARIVRGKTVLKSGGKEHTLARTDLTRLIRDASSP